MDIDRIGSRSPVRARLTFLSPTGARPRVVMPAGDNDRIERTGTYESVEVAIEDARSLPVAPTIDREGFALVRAPTRFADFHDDGLVRARYYAEVIALLRQHTGATAVHVFDHTVRVQDDATQRTAARREPVAFVHNDYTERSARQRVRDLFPPAEADRLLSGRIAFVNAWRPISASAERFPLAAADARSVPARDFVAVDMVYSDRVGEIYHATHSCGQRWYYFANMGPDEVMLLKCYDSAGDGRARYTAHTGFANPSAAEDAPPRRSIEVRTIVVFGDRPSNGSPDRGGLR